MFPQGDPDTLYLSVFLSRLVLYWFPLDLGTWLDLGLELDLGADLTAVIGPSNNEQTTNNKQQTTNKEEKGQQSTGYYLGQTLAVKCGGVVRQHDALIRNDEKNE